MALYEDPAGRRINFDSYYDPPEQEEPEEESEDEQELDSDLDSKMADENGPDVMDSLLEDAKRIEMQQDSFPKICAECKHKNLTERVDFVRCSRCEHDFCLHFASCVDPQYCDECCSKVEMTEETVYKTTDHYNKEKDKFYTKTQSARMIRFNGEDWLFHSRKIRTLNQTELLLDIEYHQAILSQLLNERDAKREERFRRNAGKPLPKSAELPDGVVKIETKVRKTRTISADKTSKVLQGVMAILAAMKAQGKTDEEIIQKLTGKKQ